MASTAIKILPCLDSEDMSAARRQELDVPRDLAVRLGRSAVRAADQGWYETAAGMRVDWSRQVQAALRGKVSIPPDAPLPACNPASVSELRIQVTNETTFGAARRLAELGLRPLALNFANGVQPGGGFLSGARAQEEVLCRSSALFPTLQNDPMYQAHRQRPLPDSTDWIIYSPDVPVFRHDDGTELETPWLLSFLTCAAPYAPDVGQPASANLLRSRIHRVLAVARACGYSPLVLGAWGCGAFQNDRQQTASDFCQALTVEFLGAFTDVVFAITDWSPERKMLGPFRDQFAACEPAAEE